MRPFSQKFAKNACFGLLGTILFTSGVLVLFLWSWLFDILIASMLVLKPGSQTFDLWRKPPIPLALDFYFFNWTNPEEINDPSKKPKFAEIGPYRFRELREKVNFVWNQNDTVTYQQLRRWNFDEENSVGRLTDDITTLNAVTMSAAHHIKDWNYFLKRGFSHTLAAVAPDVHIVRTVGELLFDGYDDPLVDIAAAFPFLSAGIPSFDKFGWFYTRNNSYTFDGLFNIGTAHEDFGQLKRWNYENETKFYSGECAKVHGSAAEFYPHNLERDHIGFFSPDMCRYVKLDYEKDTTIKGINGYKFSAQAGMLDNGTLRPENECYCNGECVPSGMLNVSSCRYGTPAFVSLPHFYGADPIYLSMVEGLHPERDKHETFITLEPRTAAPLEVSVRLQLNIRTLPVDSITLYENIPEIFFPMLWFEQCVSLPNSLSWGIWIVANSKILCPIVGSVMTILGASLLAYVTGQLVTEAVQQRKQKIHRLYKEEVPLTQSTYDPTMFKRKLSYLDIIYS